MKKIRVDKWLWTVRLFKSRSLATEQCKKGKVTLDNAPLKASYNVEPGQIIGVQKNGFNLLIQINTLLPNRVSATLAAPCYTDLTSEEERNKYNDWYIGKGRSEIRPKGTGRPTKRERRELDEFKISAYNKWLLDEG